METLAIALVILLMIYLIARPRPKPARSTPASDLCALARRVDALRRLGSLHDLPPAGEGITERDYDLIGADNAVTAHRFPTVPARERDEGVWFTTAPDFPASRAGFNHHGSLIDGKWVVETFYAARPRPPYQADSREVAWYYLKVMQLRQAGVSREERQAVIATEAASSPWLRVGTCG